MMRADSASSSARTASMRARTSSLSIAGLRMSPASPPVQHTSTQYAPSSWYFATVPAPFDASSSGWAWTLSRRRRASSGTGIPGKVAGSERSAVGRQVPAPAVPHPDEHTDEQADHDAGRQADAEQRIS